MKTTNCAINFCRTLDANSLYCIFLALFFLFLNSVSGNAKPFNGNKILKPDACQHYVDTLNRYDNETVINYIPNSEAWEWIPKKVHLFDCPDKDMVEIYYFRWWTYRKHIKQTPDSFVVTEYLPHSGHSKKHNTINCPAGHLLKAPIGLIGSYQGGTCIQTW